MAPSACPDENAIAAFLDARLGAEGHAALGEHLAICPACRDAVSAVTAVRSGLAPVDRASAEPPGDARDKDELSQIGRFVLMGVIGRGGMGVVYRAHDPALDRDVALKLLRGDRDPRDAGEAASARLEREAKAIARVRHPNVIAVHDVGTFEGRVFIAMELIEGETLAGFLARARREPREIIAVFGEAGLGLAAAHDAGLVHRDFKPDNVLVGRDGRVLVTDFGLACAPNLTSEGGGSGALASGSLTSTGALVGTPAYMAPEQHRGEPVSAQSDQFSFGVALWEAFAGASPFATLEDRLAGRVAPPAASARMPSRVRAALLRAMRAAPAERYPSMRVLLRAVAPPRRRWTLPALIALGAAAVAVPLTLRMAPARDACRSAEQGLAEVWNEAKKKAVGDALRASGKPYATAATGEVVRVLDRYASEWTAMRRDACEATQVRHDQSEDLLDRRTECLDARRAELDALVKLLSGGGDVIERAAGAAHGLTSLRACADTAALRARVGPPKEPAARAEAAAIEAEIGAAQGERDLGRTAAARTRIDAAVVRARKLGYAPALARALWLAGFVRAASPDPLSAEASLREAARIADGAADDVTRARAWMELTRLLAYRTERSDAAFEAAEEARAAITRLGGDELLEAKRLDGLAIALHNAGRKVEGIAMFRRSLAIRERLLGLDAPEVGESVNHLGGGLAGSGPAGDEEALALLRRSVAIDDKIYGPEHPASVAARIGVARALLLMGSFDEAVAEARADIPLVEAAQGPAHPTTAYAFDMLANALDELGRHEEALPSHRRSLAILEKAFGTKHRDIGQAAVAIGSCLTALGRLDEAEAEIERGRAVLEEILPKEHPLLVAPLLALGELRLAEKRPAEAVAPLERALDLAKSESPDVRGRARVALARALAAVHRDAEAAAMAEAAGADLDQAGAAGARPRRELAAFVASGRRP